MPATIQAQDKYALDVIVRQKGAKKIRSIMAITALIAESVTTNLTKPPTAKAKENSNG